MSEKSEHNGDGWSGALTWIGGGALLTAMTAEVVDVVGRHLGVPLLGAIEIVQAAILVAASSAILIASMAKSHARVQLVLGRLSPAVRNVVDRIMAFAGVLFFGALFAGSAWIAWDMWPGHEESELLHISYRPLRAIVLVSTLSTAILYLSRMLRKEPE